jgi:hypothetical protein
MSHPSSLPGQRLACSAAAACALALAPLAARAETTLLGTGYGRYEYSSNVYALAPGVPVPGTNKLTQSDYFLAYGGSFSVNELIERQKFYVNLAGEDFHYGQFSQLDHSEYTLGTGWDWVATTDLTGKLEVQRIHSMVSFSTLIDSPLLLQTEQRESGELGLQFAPVWRIDTAGFTRTVTIPQLDAPTFDLRESQGQAALNYTGLARIVAGVTGSYLEGAYQNPGTEMPGSLLSYHQTTGAVSANYKVSGLSTFIGQLGFTDRQSASRLNSISGVTGAFQYTRNLTGKTTMNLQLARQVTSYVINSGSELDSSAGLDLVWQATYRTGVVLNYIYTYRQLPGQGFIPGSNRLDHWQSIQLQLNYVEFQGRVPRNGVPGQNAPALFSVQPFVRYQTRSSDFPDGGFNSTSYGLLFTLQLQSD